MVYTADDINRAVYTVLNTTLKKNCKWAIKILEDVGYEVVKTGAKYGLGVCNLKTGRYVYICGRNSYRQTTNIFHHTYHTTTTRHPEKFDYFDCLNTAPNYPYWEHLANLRRNETQYRLYRLKEAKRTIAYQESAIQETLKKIEDLQQTLIREAQWLEQKKANLIEVRKELGLGRK